MKIYTALVPALLIAAFPALAQERPDPSLAQDLEALRGHAGTPGVAVGVVHRGELVWSQAFGVRSLDSGEAVDERTLFSIGSATKAFTALCAALLAAEGKLDLDEPACTYLDGFRLATPQHTEQVTVRALLSHQSGLPGNNLMFWRADVDRREVLRRLAYLQPTGAPGTRFQYQNAGYLVVGEVIAGATRASWDSVLRERVLEPLGMSATHIDIDEVRSAENAASAHFHYDGELRVISLFDGDNIAPAGALHSNVVDMARWMEAILERGVVDGRRVFPRSAVLALEQAAIAIPAADNIRLLTPLAQQVEYGFGWVLHEAYGRRVVEHGGSTDGQVALVFLVPEERLGVVTLTNALAFGLPHAISYRILEEYLDVDASAPLAALEQTGTRFAAMARMTGFQAPASAEGAGNDLERVLGRYLNPLYGAAFVFGAEDGTPRIDLLGRRGRVHALGSGRFAVDWTSDDRDRGMYLALTAPNFAMTRGSTRDEDTLSLAGASWSRTE